MSRILVFVCETDSDDVPEVGEAFDVMNDNSTWLDARLAAAVSEDELPKKLREVL